MAAPAAAARAAGAAAPTPAAEAGTVPHNLPAELSSFVAREQELAALSSLLGRASASADAESETHPRQVTLCGPGGIGKTRLALRAAAMARSAYPDGVWFAELAAVADAALVPDTLRRALGVQDTPGTPSADAVMAALRGRQALVVLDNCEHLVEATAALAAALLRACPGVRLLATSREPLGVEGEVVYRVGPLAAGGMARQEGARSDAARLFVERARAAMPDFAPGSDDALVEQVCARLDGIPLAIELAAARTSVLTLPELLERLEDRFRLLGVGPRAAVPRQRTLRAALDWSRDLLSAVEVALLRRLAVFRGSFGLEAAEAVHGELLPEDTAADTLDALTQLVRKSLVVADTAQQAGARYRLLETVRAYAAELLDAAGETERAEHAHATYYLALAERAEPALHGPEQLSWLRRLDTEHENLRTALDRLSERGDWTLARRLGAALWWYWVVRGRFAEARDRLTRLLEGTDRPADRESDLARGWVLVGAAYLAMRAGIAEVGPAIALPVVQALVNEAIEIFRHYEERRGQARALGILGNVAANVPEPAPWTQSCIARLKDSLALARAVGDDWQAALSLNTLGVIRRNLGDLEAARPMLEEALALRRHMGDLWGTATSLSDLGHLARAAGDEATARECYEEALAMRREMEDAWGLMASTFRLADVLIAAGEYDHARDLLDECLRSTRNTFPLLADTYVLASRGTVACEEGDLATARRLLAQALRRAQTRVFSFAVYGALRGCARLAVAERQWERALRLAAAAEPRSGMHPIQGGTYVPADRRALNRALAPARQALGQAAAEAAWNGGLEWSLEAAVAHALEGLEDANASIASKRMALPEIAGSGGAETGPLSPREAEVAVLVAQGLSNPQIATRLVISERTAARHVEHILNKLDFSSRAQIAAWAVTQGLARS